MATFIVTLVPVSMSPLIRDMHRHVRHVEAKNKAAVRRAFPFDLDATGTWAVEAIEPLALPTDPGPDGVPQTVIPGCERAPAKSTLQRRADAPMRPSTPQRDADHGLFGDGHKQRDLF